MRPTKLSGQAYTTAARVSTHSMQYVVAKSSGYLQARQLTLMYTSPCCTHHPKPYETKPTAIPLPKLGQASNPLWFQI